MITRALRLGAFVGFLALAWIGPATADLIVRDGQTTPVQQTVFDFQCFTTKHCTAHVNVTSAGVEILTSGSPGFVSVTNIPHIVCDSGCSGSGGTSSTFGIAFPSVGTPAGLYDGTNMVRFKGDETSGAWVNVKASVLPTGAASSANQATMITSLGTIANNSALGTLVDETAFTEGTTSSILFGGYFKAAPTALTTGQSGALTLTADRKLITSPYSDAANFAGSASQSTAMTGTTSTSLLAAPGANLRWYVTAFTCSNSHATVGTDVILQDGSSGTQLWLVPAAPVYGGAVQPLPSTVKQPTQNTALFVQNITTGASTKCSIAAYKGA